jgi:hypothetical protein
MFIVVRSTQGGLSFESLPYSTVVPRKTRVVNALDNTRLEVVCVRTALVRVTSHGRLDWLLVAAATLLVAAGLGQAVLLRTGLTWTSGLFVRSQAAPVAVANAPDGTAAAVTASRWLSHDEQADQAGSGFQMPLSMMPGMPADGQVRLAVSLSLTNSSGALRALDPAAEFVLRDERSGEQWQQVADSFGGLPRLSPHSGADGVVFFDLAPPTDNGRNLYLYWKHSSMSARLAITLNGAAPAPHAHSS